MAFLASHVHHLNLICRAGAGHWACARPADADVGGRRLHRALHGRTGSPTVILESGASSFAIDWFFVLVAEDQPRRDRAMSGWSDPRTDVETPARVVVILYGALTHCRRASALRHGWGVERRVMYLTRLSTGQPCRKWVGWLSWTLPHALFTMVQDRMTLIASLTAENSGPATGPVPIPEAGTANRRPVRLVTSRGVQTPDRDRPPAD